MKRGWDKASLDLGAKRPLGPFLYGAGPASCPNDGGATVAGTPGDPGAGAGGVRGRGGWAPAAESCRLPVEGGRGRGWRPRGDGTVRGGGRLLCPPRAAPTPLPAPHSLCKNVYFPSSWLISTWAIGKAVGKVSF